MSEKNIIKKRIFFWAALTITAAAVIIGLINVNSKPLEPCSSIVESYMPCAIIDAGHGGIDGGAVSPSGTQEAELNLSISYKIRDIMKLFGINTFMTRYDERSLDYDENKSIRENKNADLKARLRMSSEHMDCDFLSIHLNKFEQSKYRGAQVFYSPNDPNSELLAVCLQDALIMYLDNNNKRAAKESHDSVYLMKNIKAPAVTIECGFLSNPDEEKLLQDDSYQTLIALSITKGYIDYIKER